VRRRLAIVACVLALVGYFGYEAIEAPENQFLGRTVVRGSTKVPEIALTFDDGPNPPYTDRILDVLRREHVHATFFVVGRAAVAYPQTVRRIVREGNVLGNHTWDHPHLIMESRSAIRAELERTQRAIVKITGHPTRLMRPPFGIRDFRVIQEAHKLGYTVVMWSVPLPNDWEQPGDRTITRRVVPKVRDGSIIVLHDGNRGRLCSPRGPFKAHECDRSQEIAATREIVDALHARGFRFVTIPQLIADATART
jgi:peptidoglycan/xylan/chitin deacetylase (PgdA/CDA1 family)